MFANRRHSRLLSSAAAAGLVCCGLVPLVAGGQVSAPAPAPPAANGLAIGAAECTAARIGTTVPVDRIGQPVRRVTLADPVWTAETANAAAHCRVNGAIEAVDSSAT